MNKIEEIVNKYEMVGAYIEGAKRHEYKHYDQTAKDNMIRELQTLFKERERETVEGFVGFFGKQLLGVGGTWQETEKKQKVLDKINRTKETYLKQKEGK